MEYIDFVDENDEVVGQASQPDIYSRKLRHRIVHVLIFNSKGELLLQYRSKNKSYFPSAWSTSVGGHVQAGENYEQAAMREMSEELGIQIPIVSAFKDNYIGTEGIPKFLTIFSATYDGEVRLNPEEVESVKYFAIHDIWALINQGIELHPELKFLLQLHYKNS